MRGRDEKWPQSQGTRYQGGWEIKRQGATLRPPQASVKDSGELPFPICHFYLSLLCFVSGAGDLNFK